jgi:hypothetical protein
MPVNETYMKQSSNKKQQETQKNIVESVKQSHSIHRHGKDCYKVKHME